MSGIFHSLHLNTGLNQSVQPMPPLYAEGLVRPQFGQLPTATQPRDGQGRVSAGGDDQVHIAQQVTEKGPRG